MHPNEKLIQDFYTAFQNKDGAAMTACYHPDIVFSDPVFGRLEGQRAGAMWQMLTARAKDLTVTASNIHADDTTGSAHWEATYLFSATGRQVHNVIEATFKFKDGKIIEHHDTFDLWKWTRMALGTPGVLLGWSPIVQGKVKAQALSGLEKFMEKGEVG